MAIGRYLLRQTEIKVSETNLLDQLVGNMKQDSNFCCRLLNLYYQINQVVFFDIGQNSKRSAHGKILTKPNKVYFYQYQQTRKFPKNKPQFTIKINIYSSDSNGNVIQEHHAVNKVNSRGQVGPYHLGFNKISKAILDTYPQLLNAFYDYVNLINKGK